jgi:carbon monoxide dehydrogenase subunit G
MRLTDEFFVSTAPDRAYSMLLDLERIAPCVPGAGIEPPDSDGNYVGRVSVKLGPMKFVYSGRVRIAESDAATRTAVIAGEGKATGGADTARIRSVMHVATEDTGSRVTITTDLDIKGRAAQMGQGVIIDVSRRLVSQAAACIEARLSAPDGTADADLPTAGPVGGISLMASVVGSRLRGIASNRSDLDDGGDGDEGGPERVPEPAEGGDDGSR